MIPIVVVAYNRAKSLKRLLDSIEKAEYDTNDVLLIISIDKGDNADVLNVANQFQWSHGPKEVRYQQTNLKLRKHILQCGDLSLKYGNVIVLEDDLFVSPCFYRYACQALAFTSDNDRIGGISLYAHAYNVNVFEPFSPILDGADNWYFQFASSWGQAWSAQQWAGFKQWYEDNEGKDLAADNIPTTVTNWSANSWLKYYIKYLIATDRYFLYPRESMTTNFSAAGTHVANENTTFQVPLCRNRSIFHFSKLDESDAVYDSFFENTKLGKHLGIEDLAVDLYGSKPKSSKRYLLSSKILDCKILTSFARSMRPMDANIIAGIPGNVFFLYDTCVTEQNKHRFNSQSALSYRIRMFRRETYLQLAKQFLIDVLTYLKKAMRRR